MLEHLPWQAALWSRLSQGREIAHAYLLHGAQGIGKRLLAERFRAFLLCHAPQQGDACGHCQSCQLRVAGTHPDSFTLEPEAVGKAIRVDQVREAVEFSLQTAGFGQRKVLLLEPVEAMNHHAANALLKTLEEPAGATHLLLVSHQLSQLLATIKSRCQLQSCPAPATAHSLAWLASHLQGCSAEQCQELLTLAKGSPLRALTLYQQGGLEQRRLMVEGCKKLLKQQLSATGVAESWKAIPLPLVFDWCCEWIQSVLRYRMTRQGAGAADMGKVIQYLAEKSSLQDILALQSWMLEHRQRLLNGANLNPLLLLESLLIRWSRLPRSR